MLYLFALIVRLVHKFALGEALSRTLLGLTVATVHLAGCAEPRGYPESGKLDSRGPILSESPLYGHTGFELLREMDGDKAFKLSGEASAPLRSYGHGELDLLARALDESRTSGVAAPSDNATARLARRYVYVRSYGKAMMDVQGTESFSKGPWARHGTQVGLKESVHVSVVLPDVLAHILDDYAARLTALLQSRYLKEGEAKQLKIILGELVLQLPDMRERVDQTDTGIAPFRDAHIDAREGDHLRVLSLVEGEGTVFFGPVPQRVKISDARAIGGLRQELADLRDSDFVSSPVTLQESESIAFTGLDRAEALARLTGDLVRPTVHAFPILSRRRILLRFTFALEPTNAPGPRGPCRSRSKLAAP